MAPGPIGGETPRASTPPPTEPITKATGALKSNENQGFWALGERPTTHNPRSLRSAKASERFVTRALGA